MLHNFSATAYEVEELNYDNLLDMGFITTVKPTHTETKTISYNIKDKITDNIFSKNTSIQLNTTAIVDSIFIDPAPNAANDSGTP